MRVWLQILIRRADEFNSYPLCARIAAVAIATAAAGILSILISLVWDYLR